MRLRPTRAGAAALVLAALAVLLAFVTPTSQPSRAEPDFIRGVNYTAWWEGLYAGEDAERSLAALADTGANWIALIVTGYQRDLASTAISHEPPRTPTDADLRAAIDTAHALGLQVLLKPHVDLIDDDDYWRGDIGSAFTSERQWVEWFAAYEAFIARYASFAEEAGVDMFAVGTELVETEGQEERWRETIDAVRERFAGPLTYASVWDPGPDAIGWWDALDFIGVDVYVPLDGGPNAGAGELKAAWLATGYPEELAAVAERFDRRIIFTEIGYRSVEGATLDPPTYGTSGTVDVCEQAAAYEAALAVFWGRPWLAGMFWWNWDADPNAGGPADDDFTPYGKPAEQVLRAYYRFSRGDAEWSLASKLSPC